MARALGHGIRDSISFDDFELAVETESAPSSLIDDVVLRLMQDITDVDNCTMVFITLALYDYLLTFQDERTYIWHSKKHSGATAIFFINRYFTLMVALLFFVSFFPVQTDKSCQVTQNLLFYLTWIGQISQALFASLRLYAIWSGSLAAGLSTLAMHCIPLGLTLAMSFETELELTLTDIPEGLNSRCMSFNGIKTFEGSMIGYVFANALATGWALALTWAKTYRLSREARAMNISVPLSSMLLRDGGIQFLGLTALTTVEVIWLFVHRNGAIHALVLALSSIFVSHFILHLRQVHFHTAGSGSGSGPSSLTLNSVVFAQAGTSTPAASSSERSSSIRNRIVGNLGAPLRPLGGGLNGPGMSDSEEATTTTSADSLAVVRRHRRDSSSEDDESEKLLYPHTDLDAEMGQVFDDAAYGENLLSVIHRGDTQDGVVISIPLPIGESEGNRRLLGSDSDLDSDEEGVVPGAPTYGHEL